MWNLSVHPDFPESIWRALKRIYRPYLVNLRENKIIFSHVNNSNVENVSSGGCRVKNEVTHVAMCVRCGAMRASGWRRGDTAQGSAIFWATAASFALRRPYFLVWPRYWGWHRPSICRPYRLPLGIRPARVSSLRAELHLGRQQRRADELLRAVSSWRRRMKRKRT